MSVCPRTLVVTDRYTHHRWGGLILVLILCLLPRAYAIAHTEVIQRDGVTFIRFARALLAEGPVAMGSFDQHPGYPLLLAAVHSAVYGASDDIATWEHAGQMISLTAGTLATVGVWCLGGMLLNWRAAWVGAGLFALSRKWTLLGADVMSDATMLCLWVGSLVAVSGGLMALRQGGGAARAAILTGTAGTLGGLAYLVRPEGAGAVVVGLGAIVWLGVSRAVSWRALVLPLLTMGVSAALIASVYAVSIGGITKKKDLVPLVPTALGGGSPGFLLASIPPAVTRGPAADFSAPVALAAQTTEALGTTVTVLVGVFVLSVVVHFSLPLTRRKPFLAVPSASGRHLIVLVVLLYVPVLLRLHATAGYLDWRHCMPIAFVLVPLAGAGLIALTDLLATAASPLRLRSLTVRQFVRIQWCWVFPAVALAAGSGSFRPLHAGNSHVIEASEFVRQAVSAEPQGLLATNLSWILHYSAVQGTVVDSSASDPDTFLARVAAVSPTPTHLAISERWLRPGDRDLLLPKLQPPGYLLLREFSSESDGGDVIRVYRRVGANP